MHEINGNGDSSGGSCTPTGGESPRLSSSKSPPSYNMQSARQSKIHLDMDGHRNWLRLMVKKLISGKNAFGALKRAYNLQFKWS